VASGASAGELFECRVARLYEGEGGFVRRRVDLQGHIGEKFTVTDLDVLVTTFSPTLESRVTAGECKTTEAKNAPNAADRLLWLTGVRRLVNADASFLATTKPASDRVRHLAQALGSEVLDTNDVQRREQLAGLNGASYGPHDPDFLVITRQAFNYAKRDDELKRVSSFTRSELWLAPPFAALKRALGACRLLAKRWSPRLPDQERQTVEWLMLESIVGLVLAVTKIAGICYRLPEAAFERYMVERLAEGVVSYHAMQELSDSVDKFLMGVLTDAGVDPARRVASLGALQPRPPSYTEPLTELIVRLAASPKAAADLPRLTDWRVASYRKPPLLQEPALFTDAREVSRLLRLVTTFLEGRLGVPEPLLEAIGNGPPGGAASTVGSEEQQSTVGLEQPGDPAAREDGMGLPIGDQPGDSPSPPDPGGQRTQPKGPD
jgi:hypothetical protein